MFDAWHNAPWSERGIVFKNIVESVLMLGTVFFLMGIAGGLEKL